MAKPQDRVNINQILLPFIDDDSVVESQTPLFVRKSTLIAIFNDNNRTIETKVYETSELSISSSNRRRKKLLYRLKICAPFIFLFLLCFVPLIIKLAPVKSNYSSNIESSKLLLQDILQTVSDQTKPITVRLTTTTTTTQATSKITKTSGPNDFLLNQIIYRIKNNLSKTLVIETTRLKSPCSNGYVAIRDTIVVAKADEQKAFSLNYTLIEILRFGHYVALRNVYSKLYICYDDTGFVKPLPQNDVTDMCIFRMKVKNEISSSFREFYSASRKYSDSQFQFKRNGYVLKAHLSMLPTSMPTDTLDLYLKIANLKYICPGFGGLILHKTQMDNIQTIENKLKIQRSVADASRTLATASVPSSASVQVFTVKRSSVANNKRKLKANLMIS